MPHKIASMNLDGTEPEILWSHNLQKADELSIDIEGNRLFWSNAGMRSVSQFYYLFVLLLHQIITTYITFFTC